MMSHKTGLSAQGLCDVYEFGSYQTAWVSAAFKKWLIHGVLKVVYSSDILSLIFK